MARGHLYRVGRDGRSMITRPGIGGTTVVCRMACAACGLTGEVKYRVLPGPEQIDQKFAQRGWQVAKHLLCPDCASKTKEKPMAAKPSAGAMKAQWHAFELLSTHFDKEAGAYEAGWSDAKVAAETGMAPEFVTDLRRTNLGELKEPDEIRSLRADINAAEQLMNDNHGHLMAELAKLRTKMMAISQRWQA